MTDLFDHAAQRAEADKAKAEGMQRAEDGALPEWSILMGELVRKVALLKHHFTADDVFDQLDLIPSAPTTHDKRAFGPVMNEAARKGICRKTNTVTPSRRKKLHASPRAIWESLIV